MNNRRIKGRPGIIKGKFMPVNDKPADSESPEKKAEAEKTVDTAGTDQSGVGYVVKREF